MNKQHSPLLSLARLEKCGIALVAVLTIAHCGYVSAVAAQTSLSGENSKELQRLLAVQTEKTAVPYSVTQPPRIPVNSLDRYLMWNEIALDTTAIDHTAVVPASGKDPRRFGEQLGPSVELRNGDCSHRDV